MSGKIYFRLLEHWERCWASRALTIVRLRVQFAIALVNCQPCIGKSNLLSAVRTFKQAGSLWLGSLERRGLHQGSEDAFPYARFHIGLISGTPDVTDLGF
jgi:hypothetical protein